MALHNLTYILERSATGAGVGWFKCLPVDDLDLAQAITYLEGHPFDAFMHKYVLDQLGKFEPREFANFVRQNRNASPCLRALIYEAWIRNWKFESAGIKLDEDPFHLIEHSPLIDIRWASGPGKDHDPFWLKSFASNFYRHTDLPAPKQAPSPFPFDVDYLASLFEKTVHIKELVPGKSGHTLPKKLGSPKAFIKDLNRKLESLNILSGWETRTEATLSPFAVERPWNLDTFVSEGRNQYRLKGMQISYGKGLNIHQARISCLMETVERYSAFANFRDETLEGYLNCQIVAKGSYEQLIQRGYEALDPNKLSLEVAYGGHSVVWIQGEKVTMEGSKRVLVPAQLIFLFSNFDEMSLTSGISSTGLGAGITVEDAKLSALHEILERDAEKVVPYHKQRCFRLESDDERVSELLSFLEQKGINVQFLDLTSEFGVPCYKAFIRGPNGVILKGTSAHMDGTKAIVSALLEIPYPYPYWFGSMEPLEEIPTVSDEEIPNYSSGDPGPDLEILENLLLRNGYEIIYVDLTREEIGIPVVRAIVPGLEFMTFFDRYTPLPARQFAHYLLNSKLD